MKGVVFQKPLELTQNIQGETWRQGDAVSGRLEIKSHGGSGASTEVAVALAVGDLRQLRQKAADTFEILEERTLPVQAGSGTWEFKTATDCPITDTGTSLFVLYGGRPLSVTSGILQLPFKPAFLIEEYLRIFNVRFNFVVKTVKNSKGFVEAKLAPPSGREFAKVESAQVSLRLKDDVLSARVLFQVKTISATLGELGIQKTKKTAEEDLLKINYMTSSGRINDDCLEKSIAAAIATLN